MRFLICGDRNWSNSEVIRQYLEPYREHFKFMTIIHGDCRGADRLAAAVAEKMGCYIEAYPADWNRYGKAAGPLRNQQMLDQGRPDIVLAFHDDITNSRGTADMVRRAKKAGISVTVIDSNGLIYG